MARQLIEKGVGIRFASKLALGFQAPFSVCYANPNGSAVRTAACVLPKVSATAQQQADCAAIASAKRIEKEPKTEGRACSYIRIFRLFFV